jgi:phospholipid/cholesterol/gamma-HCH transport system substrate-binding protein
MKLEAKIGLFVVSALIALLFLSTQVTSLGKWGQKGYFLYANISDASGIEQATHVLMNGVLVGEVKEMKIQGKKVHLILFINEGIEIPQDSSLIVSQESLLGAKGINISAGDSLTMLRPNGILQQTKAYASFEQTSDSVNLAARELGLLVRDLRATLDEEHRAAIQDAIIAYRDLGINLDGMVIENREDLRVAIANFKEMSGGFTQTANTVNKDLPTIMARIDSLSKRLDNIAGSVEHSLPEAVDKFVKIEDNVSAILVDNRTGLKATIDSAGTFFKSAENAFDKVDSLLSNYTTSELQVAIHTDYLMKDAYAKTYLGVTYLPNPETYYMLDLVSTDDYSQYPSYKPGPNKKGVTLISAQYGKRFDNTLLRFGAIESTGGIGMDYFMNHDKIKLSAEAFDWNAVNDVRGSKVHTKVQGRYQVLKHMELYGGWDNFLNSAASNFYFGLGLRFVDNDLKYLSGAAIMAR